MTNQIHIFKDERVSKALVYLSIPTIITALIFTIHNLIDTVFISMLKNNAMIAATTVAFPIGIIFNSLAEGLGCGSGTYIGRLLGRNKDQDQIHKTIVTTMTLSLIISFITILVSFTCLDNLINLFTDDLMTRKYTFDYSFIILVGFGFSVFDTVISSLLRSVADVKYPMYATFVSIIINTILNPILMFVLDMGIKGAALATVIAQATTCFLLIKRLFNHSVIKWRFGSFGLDLESVKNITNVGLSAFLRNGLPALTFGIFAKSAGLFGTNFVAGAGIARKAEYLATFVIVGVAGGCRPFTAYNYGAKDKKRLVSALKQMFTFTTLFGILMGVIFYFFPNVIMHLVTSDISLIKPGSMIIKGYALGFPVVGIYQVLANTFQAMGKGKISSFLSIMKQTVIYCPLIYFLPRWFNEIGFVLAQPLVDWLIAIVALFLFLLVIPEIKNLNK